MVNICIHILLTNSVRIQSSLQSSGKGVRWRIQGSFVLGRSQAPRACRRPGGVVRDRAASWEKSTWHLRCFTTEVQAVVGSCKVHRGCRAAGVRGQSRVHNVVSKPGVAGCFFLGFNIPLQWPGHCICTSYPPTEQGTFGSMWQKCVLIPSCAT